MSITTKTGDNGTTSLFRGGRVSKNNSRIETYGTLDELCSFLGLSKSLIRDKHTRSFIERIQRDLFVVCSEIATKKDFLAKLKERISKTHVNYLENEIVSLERSLCSKRCCFVIPGENEVSALLDVCRAVSRRAERLAVGLKKEKVIVNRELMVYLNRLSDLLYLLARKFENKR